MLPRPKQRWIMIILNLFFFLICSIRTTNVSEKDSVLYFTDGNVLRFSMRLLGFIFCFPQCYLTQVQVINSEFDSTSQMKNSMYFINASKEMFISILWTFENLINEVKSSRHSSTQNMRQSRNNHYIVDSNDLNFEQIRLIYIHKVTSCVDEIIDSKNIERIANILGNLHLYCEHNSEVIPKDEGNISGFVSDYKIIPLKDAIFIWLEYVQFIVPAVLYDSLSFDIFNYPQPDNLEMKGTFGMCSKVSITNKWIVANYTVRTPLFKRINNFRSSNYSTESYDSTGQFLNLDEFVIFQKAGIADISMFSAMTSIVLDSKNGFKPVGYLSEHAKHGDLLQSIQKEVSPIKLNKYFYEQIFLLAKRIHFFHQHGAIHLDIKNNNIFVIETEKNISGSQSEQNDSYELILGDFGSSCQLGKCNYLGKAEDVHRYPSYPRELFANSSPYPVGTYSDWYEFGTMLRQISLSFPKIKDRNAFFWMFNPLIMGLVVDNPDSRWNWNDVEKYFEELLSSDLRSSTCAFIYFDHDSLAAELYFKKNEASTRTTCSLDSDVAFELQPIIVVCKTGYCLGYFFPEENQKVDIFIDYKNGAGPVFNYSVFILPK